MFQILPVLGSSTCPAGLFALALPLAPQAGEVEPEIHVALTWDVLHNADGGRSRTTAGLLNLDVTLASELGEGLGAPLRGYLYFLANAGGSISAGVGDLQGVDNIEAPGTAKLFEAWLEQDLEPEGAVRLLAGLYDIASEFDIAPAAEVFLHSSPGTGADLGNSGRNGPSTFPSTSLGLRLALEAAQDGAGSYARLAVLDGVPGDPGDPGRTQVILDGNDGLLLAAEVGREVEGEGKLALGAWHYTTRLEGFGDEGTRVRGNPGAYVLAQRDLGCEGEPWSVFARAGFADARVHPVDRYFGLGLVRRGIGQARRDDVLGLAVAAARLAAPLRAADAAALEEWELAYELTWRAQLGEHVSLQPELQYIAHPGGDPSLDGAWVVGARVVVGF